MRDTLLILGASVRAAACSARRSGFAPYCGDLFFDLDLARWAPGQRVTSYPQGLAAVADSPPAGHWTQTAI